MQERKTSAYFAVFFALLGSAVCQYGYGGTDNCGVTTTSLGCANYRVLGLVKDSNFLRVNPDGSFFGFSWDLLNALKESLGFRFTLSLQTDGAYGGLDANGKWNGMVGQLVDNTTDIVITDFTMTSQRLMAIDYTAAYLPYHVVPITLANASLSGIKYAVQDSSAELAYIRGSRESHALEIWASIQANLPTSLVPDDNAGLALVKQGGWAYVTGDTNVQQPVRNSNGQLVINHPALHTFYFALGVQRGSPIARPLSIALLKLQAKGLVQELLTKWDLAA